METYLIMELTSLKIVSEEEAKMDSFSFEPIDEYDDPVEAEKIISKHTEGTSTKTGDICISWYERVSKTEYYYRIYRTGESKWILVYNMQFLD